MDVKEILRQGLARARMVTQMVLDDLNDADLLVRPVAGANHIAWQLGHVISTEHHFGQLIREGSMPSLPEGFSQQHAREAAGDDDPDHFLRKDEYLKLYGQQREALVKLLGEVPATDLDKPAPESIQRVASTVGDMFQLAGDHEIMHTGQYSVLRRKLGKPVVF